MKRLRDRLVGCLGARVFYGWCVVGVGLLVMFGTGPGQSHLVGLFFDEIAADLGLSRTSIALAYGGATLLAALALPYLGQVIDRVGALRVVTVLVLGLGLASYGMSLAASWWHIAIGFALLRFLAQGGMTLASVNAVSHWFARRRGFALGVMVLGFPLSIAIHPPVGQWLIDTVGWREAWLWIGVSTWVLLLPGVVFLWHDRPEPLGLRPDGGAGELAPAAGGELSGLSLAEAVRTPAFYVIAAALFSLAMLVTALHVENRNILVGQGLSAQSAAWMFTITGAVAAATMPLVGRMLDRVRTERMIALGLGVTALTLLSATWVEGGVSAVIYAAIFGLNNAVNMTYFAFMWPRFFGRRHLGSIQGVGQMVGIVGASLGPLPLAVAIDHGWSLDYMLGAMAMLPLALVLPVLVLLAPHRLPRLT